MTHIGHRYKLVAISSWPNSRLSTNCYLFCSPPVYSTRFDMQVNKTDAKVIVEHEVTWIKANLNGNGYYRVHYPPEVDSYFAPALPFV